jgi:maleate isomerase
MFANPSWKSADNRLMYAWRARVGIVNPTHRGKVFALWYKTAPEGVEIIPTFVGFRTSDRQTFEAGFERAERLAEDLKAAGCDIVVVSGTPPVLLKGLDFEREWRDRLSQKIGVPVISQMEPHAQALVAMGIRRVAIATYYGDELNQAIVKYFGRFDIEGVVLGGFQSTRAAGQALYTTSLKALDDVSYIEVYQYCKRGVRQLERPVDGLYINGGGWDAAPAVASLEADLDTKVVFAQAAEIWLMYRTLGIHVSVPYLGALLRN